MSSIKGRYARIEIPLDTAETGKELHITGDYLSIISITGEGSCEVKLDHRHSQLIDLREIVNITGRFEKLYLTTDGAGGICSIVVGNGLSIQVQPDPQVIWSSGNVFSNTYLTTDIPQRFTSTGKSQRFKSLEIFCFHGTRSVYVGAYDANTLTFNNRALLIGPMETLRLEFVDLYELGYSTYSLGTYIRLLGINEY